MELKFLLEKYKSLGYSQKRIQEIVLEVFKQNSFVIESEKVEVKNSEIKINISGPARAQFILYKTKIEEELQNKLKKEGLVVTKIF